MERLREDAGGGGGGDKASCLSCLSVVVLKGGRFVSVAKSPFTQQSQDEFF